nr:MAG TPA: hypothetical protein [Caudoviricetes sp.]
MNESLLFGVRVRRVFVVLRLLHGGCNHEEQPGTVQQNNLKQREDHQSDKNCSNHSVPPKKWAKENHRPGGWWLILIGKSFEVFPIQTLLLCTLGINFGSRNNPSAGDCMCTPIFSNERIFTPDAFLCELVNLFQSINHVRFSL